jgi:hypothetical protein
MYRAAMGLFDVAKEICSLMILLIMQAYVFFKTVMDHDLDTAKAGLPVLDQSVMLDMAYDKAMESGQASALWAFNLFTGKEEESISDRLNEQLLENIKEAAIEDFNDIEVPGFLKDFFAEWIEANMFNLTEENGSELKARSGDEEEVPSDNEPQKGTDPGGKSPAHDEGDVPARPDFDWEAHNDPDFNAGTFAGLQEVIGDKGEPESGDQEDDPEEQEL